MLQSLISLGIFAIASAVVTVPSDAPIDCPLFGGGDLFKAQRGSAVYVMNEAGQRAVFPNGDVFFSWYSDFSKVKTIPNTCVEKYPEGPTVHYRPGSRLLKSNSPDVYAILPENKLAKIKDEEVARALYGNEWGKKVRVLNDEQLNLYKKTDKIISEKTPHDGMFVKQNEILYYVESGNLIEIYKNNGADVIEILHLEDEDVLIMPVLPSAKNESAEKIYKRNLLHSSADRLLAEQKIMEQALQNMRSVRSVHKYSKLYLENIASAETEELNDSILDAFRSGRIVADSFVDRTDCNTPKTSTELSIERKDDTKDYFREGFMDIRTFGEKNEITTYFQFRNFNVRESENKLTYELLQDKWTRYNRAEFEKDSEMLFSDFGSPTKKNIIAGENATPETCDSSILFGAGFGTKDTLTITKNLGNVILNERQTFHYGFEMDTRGLKSLLSGLNGMLDNGLKMRILAPFELLFTFLEKNTTEVKNAELWIDAEDRVPHKLVLTLVSEADKEEITYEVELSNFNDEYNTEVPEESTSSFEMTSQILEKIYENLNSENTNDNPAFQIETFDILPVDPKRDHSTGNPDAPITIVEYVDFECPFCKNFYSTMKEVIDTYQNDVRWVIRQYPLPTLHERANYFAHLTECAADQNKFWESIDAIYEFPRLDVSDYAKKLKISGSQLSSCVASKKHQNKINEDIADGNKVGVLGVPHSIIIGVDGSMTAISGAVSYETMSQAIELFLMPILAPQPY